jgi:acetylornithine deacetylase/succinyl-diaminopimelate desuccinylase-like protein
MLATNPTHLQAERLMEHLKVLTQQIGPRPATSRQERRAAEYARQILESLGVEDIRDQFFTSADSAGWSFIPLWALGLTSGLFGGRLGKIFGGLRLLYAAKSLRDVLLQRQPPYLSLLAQGASQNVIARMAPSGDVKQRVYLIAHLDTSRQRYSMPVPLSGITRIKYTSAIALLGLAGASMIADSAGGKKSRNKLQLFASLTSLVGLAAALYDETQPYVEGANDNASGVAALLALASQLSAQPLANTEVTLLFTGCAEPGAVGISKFLDEYAPPRHNSVFINLQMVGAGRLGYASQEGASAFSSVRPTPQLTVLAANIARENPAYRVNGVALPLMSELTPVLQRGYEGITIAGYDDHNEPVAWHRTSDMSAGIEADTLVRATQYTWSLLQALDGKAGA